MPGSRIGDPRRRDQARSRRHLAFGSRAITLGIGAEERLAPGTKVRPAHSEVTWMWVLSFGLRLLLQFNLFQEEAASLLGIVQLLTGWPATIILLIVSYLYGTWRLRNLGGPSQRRGIQVWRRASVGRATAGILDRSWRKQPCNSQP
jgi:hypothetical protein